MGLLDFLNSDLFAQKEQPANAFQPGYANALIGLGTGLLGSGGYSTTPMSGGQAFAQGLHGLQQGMAQDRAQALQGLQGRMLGFQSAKMDRENTAVAKVAEDMKNGTGIFANMDDKTRAMISGMSPDQVQGLQLAIAQKTLLPSYQVHNAKIIDINNPTKGPLTGPDGKPIDLEGPKSPMAKQLLDAGVEPGSPTWNMYMGGAVNKDVTGGNFNFATGAPNVGVIAANALGAAAEAAGKLPYQPPVAGHPGGPMIGPAAWGAPTLDQVLRNMGGMGVPPSVASPQAAKPAQPGAAQTAQAGGVPPQFSQTSPGVWTDQRPQIGPKIEEKMLDMADAQSRLGTINSAFKPEFLQIENRFGQTWAAIKEKMGMNLSPEQRASLGEFSQFRANALDNVNRLINILTGAAMGVDEAKRIMATAPNAGTGIFDGDSPTEFKSKLDNTTAQINSALMRYNYAKNQGIDPLKIPLAEVPKMVNEYGNSVAADLRKQTPDIAPDILRAQVNLAIRNRFGMVR